MIEKKYLDIILEAYDKKLEPYILKLFRVLNSEKQNHKTKKSLLEFIKSLSPYLGIPQGYEIYLLELYLLNYRKDGDYSSLSIENYVDPRDKPGKWTSNVQAWKYTQAQLPFKGSNLQGFWERDRKGVPQYVVISYGWYPVYIHKNDHWFEVTKRYSVSTSKHMSGSNPVKWDPNLNEKVYLLTSEEMLQLRNGTTLDEIINSKLEKLKSKEPELKSGRISTTTNYTWELPKVKVKFRINSIDIEDKKAIVNVDIANVVKRVGGREVPTPENYLKGEIPGITKEYVENMIQTKLKPKLKEFVGQRFGREPLEDYHLIKFNFNHLKQ